MSLARIPTCSLIQRIYRDRTVLERLFHQQMQRRHLSSSVPIPSTSDHRIPLVKSFISRHRNKQWEQMFQELLDYRKRHGDLLVPTEYPENPQLATWVDTQRQQYRIFFEEKQHLIHIQQQQQMKQNSDRSSSTLKSLLFRNTPVSIKKSNLTQERIQLLEKEGFIWDVHALKWEERYQDLVQYKHTHGTVIVPKFEQYETLYNWVFTQRRQYKFKLSGMDHSSLTQERIDKLDALGFIWNYQDEVWNLQFQQLQKFRRDHGHCLIPSTYFNRPLAKWVEVQRMHYRNIHKQRLKQLTMEEEDGPSNSAEDTCPQDCIAYSPLTETRIQLLDNEEFVWDVAEYQWNIHFHQLKEFSKINGHAFVPTTSLGRWCQKQRIEYKKKIQGEKTTMTDSRRDRLIQVGFLFDDLPSIVNGSDRRKYRKKPKVQTLG